MLPTKMQERQLQGLLRQLGAVDALQPEELITTHAYIFDQIPFLPFIPPSGLHTIIDYLRMMIADHGFTSLWELEDFYVSLQNDTCNYLDEVTDKLSAISPAYCTPVVREPGQNWSGTGMAVPIPIRRPWQEYFALLLQWMMSDLPPVSGGTFVLLTLQRYWRRLFRYDGLGLLQPDPLRYWQSALVAHSRMYLEQFYADRRHGAYVALLDGCKKNIRIRAVRDTIRPEKQLLPPPVPLEGGIRENGQFLTHIYQTILSVLHMEMPIRDRNFKRLVLQWLFFSKKKEQYETFQDSWGQYEEKWYNRKWTILTRPPGLSWMTSDNPGVMITVNATQMGPGRPLPDDLLEGIAPDTIIYYPFSKAYCLRIQPGEIDYDQWLWMNTAISFEPCSQQEWAVVNRLTVGTNTQVVIVSERKLLQKLPVMIRKGKHRAGAVLDKNLPTVLR